LDTINNPIGYQIENNLFDSTIDYSTDYNSNPKYITNNFISKYIESFIFNLSFKYENLYYNNNSYTKNNITYVNVYTGNRLPKDKNDLQNLINKGDVKLIMRVNESKYYEILSLNGGSYLFFIADNNNNTSSKVLAIISDIEIVSKYHELNNEVVNIDNVDKSDIIFSAKVGVGNNYSNSIVDYSIVKSKIGNGSFESGIWKDGIWNNGWRTSENYNFLNIFDFYTQNEKLIFTIYGNTHSVSKFNLGDKVSISNIISIDINNDRRLLKDNFIIINKSDETITLEIIYDFPIRSIEKDSENHYIVVSKNIWLNGKFLNGVFNGIWNDGVFSGYPFITKMPNSHWIDGTFNGGHFKSEIISIDAKLKIPAMDDLDIYWEIESLDINGHNLEIEDEFDIINYDGLNSKLTDLKVIEVLTMSKFRCNILKDFGRKLDDENEINMSVKIITKKKSGLIQNFTFNDNNISNNVVSDIKSISNLNSRFLFSYNSWMDLIYEDYTATNLLKPQTLIDSTNYFYSENNLYGYITTDVLSSNSRFRDSFSNKVREYKLGTKWKIYHDYIGDSSYFDDYLHSIYTPKRANDLGWDWTISPVTITGLTSSFIFNRSDEKDQNITGKELIITAQGDGGILNLQNKSQQTDLIPNRYNQDIKPLGYSMVSFDLISFTSSSDYYEYSKIKKENYTINNLLNFTFSTPILNFTNINTTKINIQSDLNDTSKYATQSTPMFYLPIYENIDHSKTKNKSKVEYFFNKRDLLLKLTGGGIYGENKTSVIIDNLKFYELDMIPFFQYLNYENVNDSIQIPYGIIYKKYNSLIDNRPFTSIIINSTLV
jgi:hypothetical protein